MYCRNCLDDIRNMEAALYFDPLPKIPEELADEKLSTKNVWYLLSYDKKTQRIERIVNPDFSEVNPLSCYHPFFESGN